MTIVATQEVDVGGSYSVVATIQDITDELLNALNDVIYVRFSFNEYVDGIGYNRVVHAPYTGKSIENNIVKLYFPIFRNSSNGIYKLVDFDENEYGQFQFTFTSVELSTAFIETNVGASIYCAESKNIFVAKRIDAKYFFEHIQSDTYDFTSTGIYAYYAFTFKNDIINTGYAFNQSIGKSSGIKGCEYNDLDGLIIRPLNNLQHNIGYNIYRDNIFVKTITSDTNDNILTNVYGDGIYKIKITNLDEWYQMSVYFDYTVNTGQIKIHFYQNSSENIVLNKTIEEEFIISGKLKTSTSIINPEIVVGYQGVFDYNYCYIPAFKRYYYITNITSLRTGLWQISMSVDVLMSYKDNILEQSGIISRNEFEYDTLLIDEKVPSNVSYNYSIYAYGDFKTVTKADGVEKEFTWTFNNANYIITTLTGFNLQPNLDTPDFVMSPNIQGATTPYYIDSATHMNMFWKRITTTNFFQSLADLFTNYSDGITASYICPLDLLEARDALSHESGIYSNFGGLLSKGSVWIGQIDVEITAEGTGTVIPYAYPISGFNRIRMWSKIENEDTIMQDMSNFVDREGYSTYSLFLPFIGFVSISPDKIYKGFCKYVVYDVDIVTGDFVAYFNNTDPTLDPVGGIFTYNMPLVDYWIGNMYTSIPLGRTNQNDINRNIFLAGIEGASNIALAGINAYSGYNKATSMLTPRKKQLSKKGKAMLESVTDKFKQEISGDVFSTTLNIASAIQQGVNSANLPDNILKNRFVRFPYIIKTTPDFYYPDDYNHNFGRPLQQTRVLSDVHGYTEVGVIHLNDFNTATVDELNEIENLLLSGIILP